MTLTPVAVGPHVELDARLPFLCTQKIKLEKFEYIREHAISENVVKNLLQVTTNEERSDGTQQLRC